MADSDPGRPMIEIAALPPQVMLRLKSWRSPPAAAVAPVRVGGHALPAGVGDMAGEALRVHGLAPAEWLLVADPASLDGAAIRRLEGELAAQGVAVVDASHALVGFSLQGAAAREVLCRGSGIDFHPARFPSSRCARTRLAQVAVVVVHARPPDCYELYVARSHADYLYAWLRDAAREWPVDGDHG